MSAIQERGDQLRFQTFFFSAGAAGCVGAGCEVEAKKNESLVKTIMEDSQADTSYYLGESALQNWSQPDPTFLFALFNFVLLAGSSSFLSVDLLSLPSAQAWGDVFWWLRMSRSGSRRKSRDANQPVNL